MVVHWITEESLAIKHIGSLRCVGEAMDEQMRGFDFLLAKGWLLRQGQPPGMGQGQKRVVWIADISPG